MEIRDIVKKLEELKNRYSELCERDTKNWEEIIEPLKNKNISEEEKDAEHEYWGSLTSDAWDEFNFDMWDMNSKISKFRGSLKKYHNDLYNWFTDQIKAMDYAERLEERYRDSKIKNIY